jgi:putative tryptophan/tyrosine transport system substrate-binding protein
LVTALRYAASLPNSSDLTELDQLKRRSFIKLLGVAATWPLAARAQQPAVSVIGYLNSGSPDSDTSRLTGLRHGLNETGYVEGRNLVIDYRWAGNQFDRLPALAVDLVQIRVAVIVSPGLPATRAAKAATSTIPIVFGVGFDPVQVGLVASLNRPGGNLTGFNQLNGELGAKALALLHELVPSTPTIGFLENPNNPVSELTTSDVLAAAVAIGLQIQTLKAGTDREIDAAFESLVQARTGALLVGNDVFFNSRIEQITALAARHAIPVMYSSPEFVVVGGLISYGASLTGSLRQIGLYTGRILKGEKPADLPVIQATKFELAINLKTAKALGLTVPPTLLALADEVID